MAHKLVRIHTMKATKILVLATFIIASLIGTAKAYFCAPTAIMDKLLAEKYKEVVRGRGVVGQSAGLIYVSRDGGFSFILRKPNGTTCMLLAGGEWEFIYQETTHEDEDSVPNTN